MIDKSENPSKDLVFSKELKLIQSQADIQNPEVIQFGTSCVLNNS